MHARIKELRKYLKLSQAAFGAPFGASRDMINNVENERAAISELMISAMCHEYNVNETWLRTGEGEMFIEPTRDEEIAAFVGRALRGEDDNFKRRLLSVLSHLTEEEWEILEKKAKELAGLE